MREILDDTIIWRYMPLESFMSLLSNQSLSFCRYDKLKSIDAYECSKSKYELEQSDFSFKMLNNIGEINGNTLLRDFHNLKETTSECEDELDKRYFINCWHMNNYESVAMWDSFTSSKTGIAIKTTVGRLKKSIENNQYELIFEPIKYVDLKNSKEKINKVVRKTKYFEYENELRVYFEYIRCSKNEEYKKVIGGRQSFGCKSIIENPERISVGVNLNELIDEIVVSPKSDDWFLGLIENIMKDYKIDKLPKVSDIRVNSIELDKNYELINEQEEFIRFIESSSEGSEARNAEYRMSYDTETGEIIACYPSNIKYKEIQEPYVITTWEVWKKWCNNNNSVKVNTSIGEIIVS